jgi:peptidoglycan hydrolase-like protein with peptidoglycan-binding domain
MKTPVLLMGAFLASSMLVPVSRAQTTPSLTYVQPLAPQATQTVQERLRQLGAYRGRVDGIWGADSQTALEHFQQSHGLQVTGQMNQATAKTLGLQPGDLVAAGQPAQQVAPTTTQTASLSPDAIRAVQQKLRQMRFYSGAVDGVWGAETQTAIQHFQQGRGLQPTGQLNPATITALGLDPNSLGMAGQTVR